MQLYAFQSCLFVRNEPIADIREDSFQEFEECGLFDICPNYLQTRRKLQILYHV